MLQPSPHPTSYHSHNLYASLQIKSKWKLKLETKTMQLDQEKKRGYLEERHHSHHIDRQSNQRVREEDFDTLGNAPIATCWLSPTWRNIRLKGKERKGKGAAEAEAKEERSLGGRGRKKEGSLWNNYYLPFNSINYHEIHLSLFLLIHVKIKR